MTALMVVWPKMQSSASAIHLYLPNYRPRVKERDPQQALCGVSVNMTWEKLAPSYRDLPQSEWTTITTPTGRWHQPFDEAYEYVTDPWKWCPICLGRALGLYGKSAAAAALLKGEPDAG